MLHDGHQLNTVVTWTKRGDTAIIILQISSPFHALKSILYQIKQLTLSSCCETIKIFIKKNMCLVCMAVGYTVLICS